MPKIHRRRDPVLDSDGERETKRRLKQEITRRLAAERALAQRQRQYDRLQRVSHRLEQNLHHVSHELLSVREEERKRISRELHDIVAQALAGINARLATLKAEASTKRGSLERNISNTQRLVEKSVGIVHRFARELRPAGLDDLGLIRSLHAFLTSLRSKTGIRVSLTASAGVERLNNATQTLLFRVTQEALTNVVRHAHASRADVAIRKRPRHVVLKIADNGRGIPSGRDVPAKRKVRLGLLGMKERVEMVGGTWTIKSTPGKGTVILAEIPMRSGKAHSAPKPSRLSHLRSAHKPS